MVRIPRKGHCAQSGVRPIFISLEGLHSDMVPSQWITSRVPAKVGKVKRHVARHILNRQLGGVARRPC